MALGIPKAQKESAGGTAYADIPLRRPGTATEAASVILAVASPLFSYVNGQTIMVSPHFQLIYSGVHLLTTTGDRRQEYVRGMMYITIGSRNRNYVQTSGREVVRRRARLMTNSYWNSRIWGYIAKMTAD